MVIGPEKDPGPKLNDLVWVASGARDWRTMRNEATTACEKVAGMTCKLQRVVAKAHAIVLCEKESNVTCESFLDEDDVGLYRFVGLYSDNAKNMRLFLENSETKIKNRAETSCGKANVKCVLRKMIDLNQKQDTTFSMID